METGKTTKTKRRFLAGISSTKRKGKMKKKTNDLVALREQRQPLLRRSDSRRYTKVHFRA